MECACKFCGGAASPVTGAQYSPTVVACYDCVVELWRWHLKRVNGRPRGGKGPSFYDHVFFMSADDNSRE